MKKIKTNKGITLISLLVTVAVLTILVAVAISGVENDGIIAETKESASDFELAQEKENLQRVVLGWAITESDTLVNHLKEKYGEDKVQANADESITVEVESGNKYIVTEDGEVTLLDGTIEEPETTPDTELVISVALDKTTITKEIESGSTATETLTATLTNATGTLTWTSSNTTVATVSGSGSTGTVTLKAAGSATITVSYGSYSATCKVTVTEKAISIALDKTTITKEIESGSTATETLTATLTNATGTLTWTSSDTSVAEVVGSGNTATVTLKAAGSATITVSYGSYSATCKVTVTEKQSSSTDLITFTIDGTTYYAEDGMTWEEWCNDTRYNTDGYYAEYYSESMMLVLSSDRNVLY